MDFVTGFATGFAMGKKMFEGGDGEVDTPDPDYQQWLDLPEPNDNQAIFLIRVMNIEDKLQFTVNKISSPSNYDNAFSVDWGDDSGTEMFPSAPDDIEHAYSSVGEYIVTFTNILGHNDFAEPQLANVVMAKYGDSMCVHLIKSTGGTTTHGFRSCMNLRYIKLPPTVNFDAKFFQDCRALRKIEFDGTINNLYSYMFRLCCNLDFSTLKFGDVTEVPTDCFTLCYALKSISLPVCTSVGNNAFSGCYYLKSASLPVCTSVGNNAFANDYNLRSFTAASDCNYGTNCFSGCYKLSPHPDGTEY